MIHNRRISLTPAQYHVRLFMEMNWYMNWRTSLRSAVLLYRSISKRPALIARSSSFAPVLPLAILERA